ncbi:MAG: hypothetical protein ACK4L7_02180, partial [Flavobacteriales bacterium]
MVVMDERQGSHQCPGAQQRGRRPGNAAQRQVRHGLRRGRGHDGREPDGEQEIDGQLGRSGRQHGVGH